MQRTKGWLSNQLEDMKRKYEVEVDKPITACTRKDVEQRYLEAKRILVDMSQRREAGPLKEQKKKKEELMKQLNALKPQ